MPPSVRRYCVRTPSSGCGRAFCRAILLRAIAAIPLRSTPAAEGAGKAPRILLIRPDHIGDLLFLTPALRLLRTACPEAHLTAMVGPWGKAVIENNPNLDEILVCEFPGFTRRPKTSFVAPYRLAQQWATQLRSRHFDMAVILRFDHWWGALLAHLARIPQRLGYAIPECQPFLSQAIPYESRHHEVQQNVQLIRAALCSMGRDMPQDPLTLDFPIGEQDAEYISRYLAKQGAFAPALAGEEYLIAIHPGAGAPVKQWRPEAWAQVGDALAASCPARIVITGSRDELDLAWSVSARMRSEAIVAAGDTSLGQLAALFARCRLVIGPDCGPLHLAVAVGTPTVHLYGPVDAVKFGPWGAPERHLVVTSNRACIPCNRLDYSAEELADHPCVREIPVQNVLEAAQKLLA
jgi:lipopolysaccharide heptosyltransferase II